MITVLLILAGALGVFIAASWSMGSVQAALFGDPPPAAVAPVAPVAPAPAPRPVPHSASTVPIHPPTTSSEPRHSATGPVRCAPISE